MEDPYILVCPGFDNVGNRLVKQYYRIIASTVKFEILLNTRRIKNRTNLAKFVILSNY